MLELLLRLASVPQWLPVDVGGDAWGTHRQPLVLWLGLLVAIGYARCDNLAASHIRADHVLATLKEVPSLPSRTLNLPAAISLRRAVIGLALMSGLYLALLFWADAQNPGYAGVSRLLPWFPAAMALAWASWGLRYLRWLWLLRRAGYSVQWVTGLPAYIAGFAFTATPGKVGELLRIRYFAWHGVPAARVTSAFVFERAVDLVTLLILALPAAAGLARFDVVLGFVVTVVGLIAGLAWRPKVLSTAMSALRRRGLGRSARVVRLLRDGLYGCRIWLRPSDLLLSLTIGLVAWLLIAATLSLMLLPMDLLMPTLQALAVYPLAMLAGAASMLPAGLGSTEAVIAALLVSHGMSVAQALTLAVAIRLCTMWWSIVCGFACVIGLERLHARNSRA